MLHFPYVSTSLFGVSSDHTPICRSFQFALTFEVVNLKNAVECSYSQFVQSDSLKIVRLRDGINFFALLH